MLSQTQKHKYHMTALMCGSKLLIYFLRQGFIMQPRLSWNSLCWPSWPWTCDLSPSQKLGVLVCIYVGVSTGIGLDTTKGAWVGEGTFKEWVGAGSKVHETWKWKGWLIWLILGTEGFTWGERAGRRIIQNNECIKTHTGNLLLSVCSF